MFRAAVTQQSKSKRELRKIGQRLRELIQKHDATSLTDALNIIDAHQNDSEVINAQQFNQSTPLILACELGKKKIVKKLLQTNCIDVNSTGHAKTNALEAALKARQFKIVFLLASDRRMNINATGADSVHPAFRSLDTSSGCPFAVARLIISRPDMDLTCVYDHTSGNSTHYRHYYHRTILHSLLREIIRSKQLSQVHAYSESETKNYEEGLILLKQVLATGIIDVNAFEIEHRQNYPKQKTTALMMAVSTFMPEVVSILLVAGADTELRNENAQRAIDIAKAFISTHQGSVLSQLASEICEMIKGNKHERVCRQSSMSMFGSHQNMPEAKSVPPEYLVPPKPSAPPAEDVNVDTSLGNLNQRASSPKTSF